MGWSTFSGRCSVSASVQVGSAAASTGAYVRSVVGDLRRSGLKSADAVQEAARRLGISDRRVRSYLYGEVVAVLAEEYLSVRERFAQHLDHEAARLSTQAELLRARRAAMHGPHG